MGFSLCSTKELKNVWPLPGVTDLAPNERRPAAGNEIGQNIRSAKLYATLAGIEWFERPDACLKAAGVAPPNIFSKSSYWEEHRDSKKIDPI